MEKCCVYPVDEDKIGMCVSTRSKISSMDDLCVTQRSGIAGMIDVQDVGVNRFAEKGDVSTTQR